MKEKNDAAEEEKKELDDVDGKRLQEAVVVLSSENMSVAKPTEVGDSFEAAMVAEAAQLAEGHNGKHVLRRKAPVNYRKEHLSLAGLDLPIF